MDFSGEGDVLANNQIIYSDKINMLAETTKVGTSKFRKGFASQQVTPNRRGSLSNDLINIENVQLYINRYFNEGGVIRKRLNLLKHQKLHQPQQPKAESQLHNYSDSASNYADRFFYSRQPSLKGRPLL